MQDFEIRNKIYHIIYHVGDNNEIYVEQFGINPEHQGKHRQYSKRIFENLMKKHDSELLYLECFLDLIPFYKKCGFMQWSKSPNSWGGFEMWLTK